MIRHWSICHKILSETLLGIILMNKWEEIFLKINRHFFSLLDVLLFKASIA